MCDDCNYVQVSRDRMVKHMTVEHGYGSREERYSKYLLMKEDAMKRNETPYYRNFIRALEQLKAKDLQSTIESSTIDESKESVLETTMRWTFYILLVLFSTLAIHVFLFTD